MEDLREVGEKVIKAIMNRKPADAGDLALGIQQLISDMRLKPEQVKEKLEHLEGLFRELAYGEAYELRYEVEAEQKGPEMLYASGVFQQQQTFNFPAVSGALPVSPIVTTGVIPSIIGQPPAPKVNLDLSFDDLEDYEDQNPCEETPLNEPEECNLPTPPSDDEILNDLENLEEFKPKWWQRKV